jgi:hypothetical protein
MPNSLSLDDIIWAEGARDGAVFIIPYRNRNGVLIEACDPVGTPPRLRRTGKAAARAAFERWVAPKPIRESPVRNMRRARRSHGRVRTRARSPGSSEDPSPEADLASGRSPSACSRGAR